MHEKPTREYAAAELLDSAAMALAGYAAERLMGDASAGTTGSAQFHWWQSYLASRLRELSAAVHLGRPALFGRQVSWCLQALSAKRVEPDGFIEAMQALAEVVASEVPDAGERIADQYIRAALADLDPSAPPPADTLDTTQADGRLTASYLLAILEGDRRRAAELIHKAVDEGLAIRSAYLDVLAPASREIGRMWHRNEISIAEEHFATATTQMVMAQLLRRWDPPRANGKTVVVAAVTGDRHGLGLQVVGDLFEMDGWRVVYLGPDIPGRELPQAVDDFKADLLLLSATLYTQLPAVESTIAAVRSAGEPVASVPILVGGHAFQGCPGLAEQTGADGYAQDADAAVALGRKLLGLA